MLFWRTTGRIGPKYKVLAILALKDIRPDMVDVICNADDDCEFHARGYFWPVNSTIFISYPSSFP